MTKRIQGQLIGSLDGTFTVTRHKKSRRALILKEISEDLELGLVVQEISKRGRSRELADVGVRIPSAESIYDDYEIDSMREMGFDDPEPVGWLTFWRPTYASTKLDDEGPSADAIAREFSQLRALIAADVERSRREIIDLLSEARRPDWATMPSSSLLVIKALAFRATHESDACVHADRLIGNVPDLTPRYAQNVEAFCRWLRSRNPVS